MSIVRLASAVLGPVLSLGLSASFVEAADDLSAQRFGEGIIQSVPSYMASRNDRALAACIDWKRPAAKAIRRVFWTYTDPGSDRPIFHRTLMQKSIARCERWRPDNDPCVCVEVAMDDRIVFDASDVPEAQLAAGTQEWQLHRTKLIGKPSLKYVDFSLKQPAWRQPVSSFTEVSLGELGFYLVVDWGTYLQKGKNYRIDYRSRDESGEVVLTGYQNTTPEVDSWRTWQWFTLRQEYDKPGLWTYEVILDGRKVAERRLRILPDS